MGTLRTCTGRGRSSDGGTGAASLSYSAPSAPSQRPSVQARSWFSPKLGSKRLVGTLRHKAGQTKESIAWLPGGTEVWDIV